MNYSNTSFLNLFYMYGYQYFYTPFLVLLSKYMLVTQHFHRTVQGETAHLSQRWY